MLTLFRFDWRTWFLLIFSKLWRNDWFLKFFQLLTIMFYLFGGEFEKKSGSIKNCGRWSDILDEMFPDVAVLTSGVGILQKILSIRVLLFLDILVGRRIRGCNKFQAYHPEKYWYILMYQDLIGHC